MTVRVLYWAQQYWPSIGGVEVLAAAFVRDMRRRGIEFSVVTSQGRHPLPAEDRHDGVSIFRLPFAHALEDRDLDALIAASRDVAALKRRLRPHLVHLHFSDPSALFHLRTAGAHPTPTLVSVQVAPPPRLERSSLLAALLSTAAWITAPSQAIADDLAALLPAVAARMSVIHLALPAPPRAPAPPPPGPAVLLCLGRLVADKGFDLALDLLPELLGEFPDVRLVIAGDGAARGDLERRAAHLGVARAVTFLGWVPPDDVPALIDRATVVVVPSRWREAFGIVALQAAQRGRPVVCTNTGGLPEVVAHQESGLVVAPEDVPALGAAVARLLRDRAQAERFGRQGRERAAARFSWEGHVAAYEALYHQLTGWPGGGPARA